MNHSDVFPALFIACILSGSLIPMEGAAQWCGDPTVNNAVCIAPNMQSMPVVCPDGSGGGIIAWRDLRASSTNVYAQRFTSSGSPQWTQNGVLIGGTPGANAFDKIILSDGAGGAFLVWVDLRSGQGEQDVYAQRINASGTALWTANGVPVCTAQWRQRWPSMCHDGSGGLIIAWCDERGNDNDIYAQRLNGAGAAQWAANGIPVCTEQGGQSWPMICSDGSGGAIMAWRDGRPLGSGTSVYAQRISGAGAVQWTANGVPVCTAPENQPITGLCEDGSGGALITWSDDRNLGSTGRDIYAQRIDASGSALWTTNGIPVCNAAGQQMSAWTVPDGSGGMFLAWLDNNRLFAQRVSSSGTAAWSSGGILVCSSSKGQHDHQICLDGNGGILITWQDGRGDYDIYGQRIDGSGTLLWPSGGAAICTAQGFQDNPSICGTGSGGAIIAWWDDRGSTIDIYASSIRGSGSLVPVKLLSFSASTSFDNIHLRWETATETNNHGFGIQCRSKTDGPWETIGFVSGSGTSGRRNVYTYTDRRSAKILPRTLFYRLKQIDVDGSLDYSPILSVDLDNPPRIITLQDPYPNPAINEVFIPFSLPQESPVTIRIYTTAGQELLNVCESAIFTGGSHTVMARTTGLPSGTYFIELTAGLWKQSRKITISR